MSGILERLRAGIDERYEIVREIGRGGMATVFLARDTKHDRLVALKVMDPSGDIEGGVARFQREIQIAARLNHPNVLALIDSGQAGDLRYYVMPFVEGESLRDRLKRESQLGVAESLRIIRAVSAGLAHAHERGLVHRDIKPENILLSGDAVLVADFGIARLAGSSENLTSTGLSLGTPNYMSPEQAGGAQVDGRTDQYALACVLYEMLTGHPPFQGHNWQVVLSRHALDPVPPIRSVRPTVPPQMELAIERALAKVPADRFGSVADFAAALPGVEEVEQYASGVGPRVTVPVPRRRRWWTAVAAGAVALVIAGFGWRALRAPASGGTERVLLAVLPLQNAGDSADAYFADGLTEEITVRLTRVRGLGVLARNNSIRYQQTGESVQDIGRRLGVRYILDGTVRWAVAPDGGRLVRVTPSLVDVTTGTALWGEPYDGQLANVFDLQTRIAEAVVQALRVQLGETDRVALRTSATQDPEAYRLYALGRYRWRQRSATSLSQAVTAFEQALALDSSYARAWSGLADAYVLFGQFGVPGLPAAEAFNRARQAATRALALDPSLAEGHASLGEIAAYADWDWAAAERHFREAIDLDPEYATAHQWYGELLAITGRYQESLSETRLAESLDPTSAVIAFSVTLPLLGLDRFEEAVQQYRRVLELDPTFWYANIGVVWANVAQRDLAGALNQLQAMGDTTALMAAWVRGAIDPAARAAARRVVAGQGAYIRQLPPTLLAPLYAGLGEADQTLATLEAAADSKDVAILGIEFVPIYDPLRGDPRFQALRARLGLR